MCEVEGERFEYETQMLFAIKRNHIGMEEVRIETVYLDDNASTHFHPIKDSLKIYKIILSLIHILLAISDGGKPYYDPMMAGKVAALGIPCFACSPQKLPQLLEMALKGQDLAKFDGTV